MGGGGATARAGSSGGRDEGVRGIPPTSTGLGCVDDGCVGDCVCAAIAGANAGGEGGCAETHGAGCFGATGSRTGAIGLTGGAAATRVSSLEIFIATTGCAGCVSG